MDSSGIPDVSFLLNNRTRNIIILLITYITYNCTKDNKNLIYLGYINI